MQKDHVSVNHKLMDHFQKFNPILYIGGIALCLFVMFFVLGKYRYNEIAKFIDNLSLIAEYIITFLLHILVFVLSYKLICYKKKTRIVYLVPFIFILISSIIYWQGFLRITDPTNPDSVYLYNIALKNDVLQFIIISSVEAIIIDLTAIVINRKQHKT